MNMHNTNPSPINNTNMSAGDQLRPMTDCTRLVVTPLKLRTWLKDTEHTIITIIIEVVQAVAFNASSNFLVLRLAKKKHNAAATTHPTAAASVGVATPDMISPMMATMMPVKGTARSTRPIRVLQGRPVASVLTGASDGFSLIRTTTYT